MIGSGLKKLAQENGMKVDKGVAYGSLGGYAATMSEGAGYKRIDFTTTFPDASRREALTELLNHTDLAKQYRVQGLEFLTNRIVIVFTDNPGTMGKIREFLAWFSPLLQQYGATGSDICTQCGCQLTTERWMLVDGSAYCLHDGCVEKVKRDIQGDNEQRKAADTGSYGMGALGAFLGSVLGAAVWALVLYMGYMAALVGLLIGFLVQKGYDLLHGKQGKGKVVILALAVIVGVLLGTFAADAITLLKMIGDGELPGFVAGDVPSVILALFVEDAEYRGATIQNILMGLVFAALGVFGMLRRASQAVADTKYQELK